MLLRSIPLIFVIVEEEMTKKTKESSITISTSHGNDIYGGDPVLKKEHSVFFFFLLNRLL